MKRPFSVTILLWLVLSLTAWSGLRLMTAIRWWNALFEFDVLPGPLYIVTSGGFWMSVGIILLLGIWRKKAWIRYTLLGTGAGFTVWYWCDKLLLQTFHTNWEFTLITTILLLIVLSVCIFLPSTKTFLLKREAHD